MRGNPFHIDHLLDAHPRRAAVTAARPFLSWLLELSTYRRLYERACELGDGPFERRALAVLDIRPICPADEAARIPARGPLIIAANHPHGLLDGLLLQALIGRTRNDVRILANHLLSRIPELADRCFFIDPFGGVLGGARSRAGLRGAHLWLKNGGALIAFPAGEVAHVRRADGAAVDSGWHSTVARLALATGADVLPAFIDGGNSPLFYAAGRVHPLLRTALLARELLRKRGRAVAVRIGEPLAARSLGSADDDGAAASGRIRAAVDALQDGHVLSVRARTIEAPAAQPAGVVSAFRRTDSRIAADVGRLAPLVESGGFRVYCAGAQDIPAVLDEIGRLREVTYRAVGEGTGRTRDLDRFDQRYLHLFAWDSDRERVVGAYRIGRTDRLVAEEGIEGLYTRTLFKYDERLIARLSPALELGRSFVRAEYQKNYGALLALWKGIGQFVVRNPEYRRLFGPVSISTRYTDRSHGLLMAFLAQNHLDEDLAALVEAINPARVTPAPAGALAPASSIDGVDRLVSDVEADGKGMPVLLRQYLKLNARLIGFNVDPQFGDALDALMLVDLAAVSPAILGRYLGREGARLFLQHHRSDERPRTAA